MPSVCENCGFPNPPGHVCNDGSQWLGKTIDGRYKVESILGAGGMGMVFEATQTSMNRKVAIKTLNPSLAAAPTFFERFKREAEVASRLHHPNVISVFDFGRAEDGTCYFVMELLVGRSLKEIVKEEGALSIRRAVAFMEQAALGLAHAHNQNCVHRDLKPHNIMVQKIDGTEFVKVLDFGLVKAMEQEEDEQLTSTGQVLGTPQYMPPEQAGGEAVDLRSDLYSLGGVFYYCLTGSSPYGANSVRKALQAALTQPVPSVASRRQGAPVPKKLEEFFRKALAREKEDRHQSCDEFVQDMFDAIEGLSDRELDALPDSATPAARESGSGSKSGSRSSASKSRPAPGSRSSRLSSPSVRAAAPEAPRATLNELPAVKARPSSGSRSAPPPPPPPAKSKLPLIAIPAVLVLGAVGYFAFKPSSEPLAPVAPRASNEAVVPTSSRSRGEVVPARAVEPEDAASIAVSFQSKPDGADIYDGERMIGRTPQTLSLERDQVHTVVFRMRGYQPLKRALDFSHLAEDAATVEVTLEPVRRAPTPPPAPAVEKPQKTRAFD